MKKIIAIILAGMLMIFATGCSAEQTSDNSSAQSSHSSASSSKPEKKIRTIVGKVKSVAGNEIEIVIGEYANKKTKTDGESEPQGSKGSGSRGGDKANGNNMIAPTNANTNNLDKATSTGLFSIGIDELNATNMAMMMGEMPMEGMLPAAEMPSFSDGDEQEDEQGGQENSQGGGEALIKLSDKIETISVPVNVPVTMAGSSNTLNFTQIMVKNIIEITFEIADDESETVSSIKIIS